MVHNTQLLCPVSQCLTMLLPANILVTVSHQVRYIWSHVTIEPVVAMYCLIIALSGIPGEELYLKKACTVNLNHSMETCHNIHDNEEAQIETQKLVSAVQVSSVQPISQYLIVVF